MAVTTTASATGCSLHVPSADTVERREQLALRAERLERMAGDVEADRLLFLREALVLRSSAGRSGARAACASAAGASRHAGVAEQRALARRRLGLQQRRVLDRAVERGGDTARGARRARRTRRVEQRLEHALVAGAEIDALGEVVERIKGLEGGSRRPEVEPAFSAFGLPPPPSRFARR